MPDLPFDSSVSEPLSSLDDWEESLLERYPEPGAKSTYRDYGANVRPGVREFYRLNHTCQTVDFVRAKKREFLARQRERMGIWEAMEYLNTLIDATATPTRSFPRSNTSCRRPKPSVPRTTPSATSLA